MHNEKLNNAFNDSMSSLLATPVDEQDHTPIRMAMIHPYTDTYIDTYLSIGMYCGRTVGFKSCVCTVLYISKFAHQATRNYKDLKANPPNS